MRVVGVTGVVTGIRQRCSVMVIVDGGVMVMTRVCLEQGGTVMTRPAPGRAVGRKSLHGKRHAQQAHQQESPEAGHKNSLWDCANACPEDGN